MNLLNVITYITDITCYCHQHAFKGHCFATATPTNGRLPGKELYMRNMTNYEKKKKPACRVALELQSVLFYCFIQKNIALYRKCSITSNNAKFEVLLLFRRGLNRNIIQTPFTECHLLFSSLSKEYGSAPNCW